MTIDARLGVKPAILAPLDQGFLPAALWNRAFRSKLAECGGPTRASLALCRDDDSASVSHLDLFPDNHPASALNYRYVERLVKTMLWQKGGCLLRVAGSPAIAERLSAEYGPDGARAFDGELIGAKVYGHHLTVETCEDVPEGQTQETLQLGRHFDGCRIGFDLGGSDRKCAAVIDGKVVHSEEVRWDPYFQKDPRYHIQGIQDSLKRAASKLPQVDAIGGSSAGIYVDNEVRVASLFRGIPEDLFKSQVRPIFQNLAREWNVPFVVVNDGEVTALAGSISSNQNAVLGIAMGTSLAAGYVTPEGGITSWLNELAFVPIDYRMDAPVDEWSGDAGCGVQYFSQQAVSRLCKPAGIDLPRDMPLAEQLIEVQALMQKGDPRAKSIYETIGIYLGYAIAHYADMYDVKSILLLGRVMSGDGADIMLDQAKRVLKTEFVDIFDQIQFQIPDEKEKRHGQASVAASLPARPKI